MRSPGSALGYELDLIGTGLLIVSPDGAGDFKILASNAQARTELAAPQAQPGRQLSAVLPEPLATSVGAALRACAEQGRLEVKVTCSPEAGSRWLNLSLVPTAAAGVQGGIVITIQDVTALQRSEAQARQAELKFNALAAGSLQGIVVSRNDRVLFCNPAFVDLFGFKSSGEVYALPALSALVHPEDRERIQSAYRAVALGERVAAPGLIRCLRRDGAEVWVTAYANATLWEGERALQITIFDVTQQRQAEQALQESEQRYRTLAENALAGVMVHQDGVPVYANDALARMAGFPSSGAYMQAVAGRGPLPLSAPAERIFFQGILEEIQKGTRELYNREGTFPRADGTSFIASARSHRILWQGRPAVLTNFLDRTESERALVEMKRSQNLLQAVFDALPVQVLVKDREHRFIMCNALMASLYGMTVEQFLTHSSTEAPWRNEEERARVLETDRQAMVEGRRVDMVDSPLRFPDGRETFNHVIKVPLRRDSGLIEGVVTVAMDVTERKLALEAQRASEERYRVLVEGSIQGVAIIRGRKLLFVNEAYARMFGYASPAEVTALDSINAVLAPEERLRMAEYERSRLKGEPTPEHYEFRGIRKDGSFTWLDNIVTVIQWEGQPAALATLFDITLRRQAEDQLKQSEERYRVLVQGSLAAIAVFGLGDLRARFANPAMLKLTGHESQQDYVDTVSLLDRVREPYAKRLRQSVQELSAGKMESFRDELLATRKDGTLYWAEFTASRVDWSGEPSLQISVLDVTARKRAEEASNERQALLARQNEVFRQDLSRRRDLDHEGIVSSSPAMQKVLQEADLVARSRVPVLIEGETGTGKEVVAEFIHRQSDRADQVISVVNCGSLTETMMDAELFGYERGAFTGATDARAGLIEVADRGTLFLDEIGDLPPNAQVRLLRFLERGVVRRVGSTKEKKVDVRILAATHKLLKEQVQAGTFREDLYHRLLVIRIVVPPLRERIEDIMPLALHLMEKFCREAHSKPKEFSDEARLALTAHDWPGNVRELLHTVQRAVFAAELECAGIIRPEHLDLRVRDPAQSALMPIKEFTRRAEQEHVRDVLRHFHGNRSKAAKTLGISERHLYRLID